MVLFLYSRVKGENLQIFRVTLWLILDNLINKTRPVWNLKNVELSRRRYYDTLDKRKKFTVLLCVLLFVLECSWLYSCVTFLDLDTTFSDGLYWWYFSLTSLFNWKLRILERVSSNSKDARCGVKFFLTHEKTDSSALL